MSNATDNKAKLQALYRRWHETRGGALEELLGVFDNTICFGSLAQGAPPAAFTATCVGKDQLRSYFDGLLSGWSMNHYTVDHMIAEGDSVAVVGSTSWTNRATHKTVETPKVDVWRFKDGRAVEFYEYYDTAKLYAAASA
jgi:uncharacterized protein